MRMWHGLTLALGLALGACSGNYVAATEGGGVDTAAADAAVGDVAPDAPPPAPWPARGARVTGLGSARFGCYDVQQGCHIDLCPPYDPGDVVVRSRPAGDGRELRLGSGTPLVDGGTDYTFTDRLDPPSVLATVGSPAADGYAPFATVTTATWSWDLLPGYSTLPVHGLVLAGTLDPSGLPTSTSPPFAGTLAGCFTPADAEAIYIPALTMTLRQLIEANGPCALDCATTSGGALDGWTLTATWEAAEVVTLVEPGAADGG
jgi:hypothetical protein